MCSSFGVRIDDTVLLAYVDGRLSPERRSEVDAAATASPAMAARLAAMEASVLPYAVAFSRQALPPLPPLLPRDSYEPE